MTTTDSIEILGRRLRLGMIGGGGESLIGPVHRLAARLDDRYDLVAAVLSSNGERSRAEAERLGVPRAYASVDDMLTAERARPDAIDVVAIVTPNDTHVDYAERAMSRGFDVICEKPLANGLAEARRLSAAAQKSGRLLCLTHNYSGYPMIREARAAVVAGELGRVHLVQVSYLQGTLGSRVEDDPGRMPGRLKWRLDAARGGPSHVLLDIGSHAHQLATYVTGDRVASVLADVGAAVEGRSAHDTASVIMRMGNGARGTILASRAASGSDNRMSIEIYGDKAGLRWEQSSPDLLHVTRTALPAEIRAKGLASLHPLARRASRAPSGHPEAFFEAFANLYRDFADLVAARIAGIAPDPLAAHIPTVDDGVAGLAFIEACVRSSERGGWTDC
ncbi:MAG: Gfo/Idh/MocA family oxidoreductase [Rhizobiaceae bacterium]